MLQTRHSLTERSGYIQHNGRHTPLTILIGADSVYSKDGRATCTLPGPGGVTRFSDSLMSDVVRLRLHQRDHVDGRGAAMGARGPASSFQTGEAAKESVRLRQPTRAGINGEPSL